MPETLHPRTSFCLCYPRILSISQPAQAWSKPPLRPAGLLSHDQVSHLWDHLLFLFRPNTLRKSQREAQQAPLLEGAKP